MNKNKGPIYVGSFFIRKFNNYLVETERL